MADTDTLSGIFFADPAAADNSSKESDATGPGQSNGSAPEMDGDRQPAPLGSVQGRVAELERLNARYREQSEGNKQESQRLAEQNKLLSQQNQELLTTFRDLLKTPPSGGTAPHPADAVPLPQRLGLKKALEKAILEGDYSEWDRLEEGLPALLASLLARQGSSPMLKPEEIDALVDAKVDKKFTASSSEQQTYQRMVTSIAQAHPFLADPKDPLYAEVWQAYDEAVKHPFMQEAYGEGGRRFTVNMPAPSGQGWGTKPMDMRMLDRVALQVQANHATAQGRRQAEERRDAPTLDTLGRQPPSSRTPSMLFTRGELANMEELLKQGIRGPKTMDEFKKYRWEKLITAEEKQRRLDVWRAGKWE